MKFMLESSNIPKSKRKVNVLVPESCDLKAFEKLSEIRDNILDFVKNGRCLYIYSSNCGNGKTTWAIKLMLQYFNDIWIANGFTPRGIFINVPTFLSMCKSTISHKNEEFEVMRDRLASVDLVVMDDIASTKLSDYDYNTLLTYIDQRAGNELSTIYTGNIFPKELSSFVGERLASRIYGSQSIGIQLKGRDMR